MQAIAVVVALALAEPPVETQPVETQPVEAQPVETQPVETRPVETQPVETQTRSGSSASPQRMPGDRMVQAGVGVVVAGLAGYGLMAVGLAIGNRAQGDLSSTLERDGLATRRDVLARGRLGNRLAIAGAVTASVALAVGIPLIAIGRRRHEAAARALVGLQVGTTGFGLRVQGRF